MTSLPCRFPQSYDILFYEHRRFLSRWYFYFNGENTGNIHDD